MVSPTDDIESRLFDLTALKMQLAHAEGDLNAFEQLRQRVVEIAMLLEEKTAIPVVKAQLGYLAAMQEGTFWEGINLNLLEELRLLFLVPSPGLLDVGPHRRDVETPQEVEVGAGCGTQGDPHGTPIPAHPLDAVREELARERDRAISSECSASG